MGRSFDARLRYLERVIGGPTNPPVTFDELVYASTLKGQEREDAFKAIRDRPVKVDGPAFASSIELAAARRIADRDAREE